MCKEEYIEILKGLESALDYADIEYGISYATLIELQSESYEKQVRVGMWCKKLHDADRTGFKKDYFIYRLEQQCKEKLLKVLGSYYWVDELPADQNAEGEDSTKHFDTIKECLTEFYKENDEIQKQVAQQIDDLKTKAGSCIRMSNEIQHEMNMLFRDVFTAIDNAVSLLTDCHKGFEDYLCDRYYEYLEDFEDDIRGNLLDELYRTNIICDESRKPTLSDYAALQRNMHTQLTMSPITKIIHDRYRHSKPLDIRNEAFQQHIENLCTNEKDLDCFIQRFAEIAILHNLVTTTIPVLKRPIEIKPLPECVNDQIRNNDQLNIAFREAMSKLIGFVKMTSAKTKWCHIKRVLEDGGLTDTMNDSAFGRLIENVAPELKADNVRKALNNNPMVENVNDTDLPYYEWHKNTTTKQQCDKVAKYFEGIINSLM